MIVVALPAIKISPILLTRVRPNHYIIKIRYLLLSILNIFMSNIIIYLSSFYRLWNYINNSIGKDNLK